MYLRECFVCISEKGIFCCLWNVLYIYRSIWIVLIQSAVSLFSVWSIHCWKWGTKVLYFYWITVSSFISVNICFVCLGTLMLGAYIIAIFFWWIESFTIISWPSWTLVTVFDLRCTLSDIQIATATLFWLPFHLHEISFSNPSLSAYLCP